MLSSGANYRPLALLVSLPDVPTVSLISTVARNVERSLLVVEFLGWIIQGGYKG
mgnify:FL=1